MPSLASQFEELLAQRRNQASMIAVLQNYVSKAQDNVGINEGIRMLDSLRGLRAIRESVPDTCSTPEQTDRLSGWKEKADGLQRNLNRILHPHIFEGARLTASKDEYDILVELLGPGEGQESIDPPNVREMLMEYIQYTLAVIHGGVEFSSHQPTRPLPPLCEEGDSEVGLKGRRSFRDLFRRNR